MDVQHKSLEAIDREHGWHPFTQMKDWAQDPMLIIEKGEGVWLFDQQGNRYIDGVSSLWVTVHGHRHPAIDQAVKKQLDKIAHSTYLGLAHPAGIELTEKLIQIAPKGLTRVFYSDSGSEGVEIALKMAYQYWQQRDVPKPNKKIFIRYANDYHGDTIGAMSVGGIDLFFEKFHDLFFKTITVNDESECMRLIEQQHEQIAGIVVEPLVQAAAGMLLHPEQFLTRLREATRKYDILLIVDEVATGFGRTGKMFACDHEAVCPDLMVVGKGLTGGYLPIAATLATDAVYQAFCGEYHEAKAFFHGHTYTANPLGCAAAIANLEVFEQEQTLQQLQPKIEALTQELVDFKKLAHVQSVRQRGFMVGIELVKDKAKHIPYAFEEKMGYRVCQHIRKKGVILRPLGSVIILMPPLSIDSATLKQLTRATYEAIEEVTEQGAQ